MFEAMGDLGVSDDHGEAARARLPFRLLVPAELDSCSTVFRKSGDAADSAVWCGSGRMAAGMAEDVAGGMRPSVDITGLVVFTGRRMHLRT